MNPTPDPAERREMARRQHLLRATALAVGSLTLTKAPAQERALRLLVGFAPGGSLDLIGRAIAEALRDELRQPVIVENKPGAGSLLAAETVARAAPDGQTLLLAPIVVTAFLPHLMRRLPIDPLRDLVPVAQLGTFQFALVAAPSVTNLAQFIASTRARPGKGSFGSVSPGTPSHFLGVMFNRAAGLDLQHVPYKGAAPALTALQGGEIDAAFVPAGNAVELHRAGRLRVLAVSGRARSALLPEVPTFSEVDVALRALQDATLWYGFFAPASTPAGTVARHSEALIAILTRPAVIERITRFDVAVAPQGPADFARTVARDHEAWGAVIRASGFTLQD